MSDDLAIYHEKLDQVHELLNSLDLDAWLIFVRETSVAPDPAMQLIAPFNLTWESALLIDRNGTRVAIVGRYDMQPVEDTNLFSTVLGYDAGIGEQLRDALASLDPQRIAINYSTSDVSADGLSYGMYLRLRELLKDTPYSDRLVSAHDLVSRLRARKTVGEQALLLSAVEAADEIFRRAEQMIVVGVSEREVADAMHAETLQRGMTTAWSWDACPIVNTGPDSPVGHSNPTALTIQPGHLVHIDFGVQRDGYCSDQQRMWYVLRDGETAPPEDVQQAWLTVRTAIQRAFEFIRPGVQGWEVDEIGRAVFREAGVPEYQHALGHGVGRAVHDGGASLAPRWDRYGSTPYGSVEAGSVYTLECGLPTSCGYLGLEEEIVVEDDGARWLAPPQTELWLIKPDADPK
ncbi:MAG: aminopeptidase P family protein [Chloroflexi bacterium]|nr:aminopeptidase P family protein [Chloroflexota bacterium]